VQEVKMDIIKINNLSKIYNTYKRGSNLKDVFKSLIVREKIELNALKEISFNVEKGELLGFLGPNGAGKSTTLKILTGVLYPTSGEVSVNNLIPWKNRKKYVANIGAVFGQKSQLIWDIPPMDSFLMNRAIYGINKNIFKKRLDEMVEYLDITAIINKPTRQLSLGERMKCEFIMSTLHNPQIVFLDEPTIGLDVVAKDKIREFIKKMNKKGVTFILTTHDLSDIEHLSNRVIVINSGEIVFDNSLSKLKNMSGSTKIIKLSTDNKILDINKFQGVKLISKLSSHDIKLEIDTNQISMGDFINQINSNFKIKDLIIEEPPIDNIIKELYIKT
jgi:ABC-2 type transport system ATP-binding protein